MAGYPAGNQIIISNGEAQAILVIKVLFPEVHDI